MLPILAISLAGALGGEPSSAGQRGSIAVRLETLATSIETGQILRVELFKIPPEILTRTRLTPEMLEQQYSVKVTIRDVRGAGLAKPLVKAIRSTTCTPTEDEPDLRWGVVFYGEDGARLEAVYFGGSGTRALVGSTPVSIRGALFGWMKTSFAPRF